METKENKSSVQQEENKDNITENYQQPQIDGTEQTVLIDPAITSETDELDPTFQQGPLEDPEDDKDDDDFPAEEDLDDVDYDLDQDTDESELDADEDDFELKYSTWNILT